jgi:hypothetical protein
MAPKQNKKKNVSSKQKSSSGPVKSSKGSQILTAPYHELYITSEIITILGQPSNPVQDLWMDVTHLVPQVEPSKEQFTVLPDIRRLKVTARSPYSMDNLTSGNLSVNGLLYCSQGTIVDEEDATEAEALRRKVDPAGTMPRAIKEDVISGVSVLKNNNCDLSASDLDMNGVIFDQSFDLTSRPIIRIRTIGTEKVVDNRFFMHIGKYMLNSTALSTGEQATIKLNVEIWYRRFVQEVVNSGLYLVSNSDTFSPKFTVPAKKADIEKVKDISFRNSLLQSYNAGFAVIIDDPINPKFSFSKLWQTIVGIVKTAAPIVSAIATMIRQPVQVSSSKAMPITRRPPSGHL